MTIKLRQFRIEVFGDAAGKVCIWSEADNNWWTVHFFVKKSHRRWGYKPWEGYTEEFGLGWFFLWARC